MTPLRAEGAAQSSSADNRGGTASLEAVRAAVTRLAPLPNDELEFRLDDEVKTLKADGSNIGKTALRAAVRDRRKRDAEATKAAKRAERGQLSAGSVGDTYAPLSDTEREGARSDPSECASDFVCLPAPADAPPPPTGYPQLGRLSHRFEYRDDQGRLFGYGERYEKKGGGKEVRPLFFGRLNGGTPGWHQRYPARPRPLFGLNSLADRPDAPVLLCEGEKAAEAAQALFPKHVCIASACGASAAATADLSPLVGRGVTIWPDHDAPGGRYAAKMVDLLHRAGVASVAVVEVPSVFPDGWDLADPLPEGVALDGLARMLAEAPEHRPAYEDQADLRLTHERHQDGKTGQWLDPGIYRLVKKRDGDDSFEEWRRVVSYIAIVAATRDANGKEHGRLVKVRTSEGIEHELAIPAEALADDGVGLRRDLLRHGAMLAAGKYAWPDLHDYFKVWAPHRIVLCVPRVGWNGDVYALPNRIIGSQRGSIVLQSPHLPTLRVRGKFDDWKREIAALAPGNSRLAFAIAVGLTGPAMTLVNEASGGFTEVGGSSIGKSTMLRVAATVGGVEMQTWRSTSNGLEATAAAHNDQTMILDEFGQVTAAECDQIAYMLGNERGKNRMTKDIAPRPVTQWRTFIYSSGEIGLSAKLGEAGKRPRPGQEVRFVDLPADAGAGHGVFEDLHGFPSGDALARHIAAASERQCGTALPAFVEHVAANVDGCREELRAGIQRFVGAVVPAGADGQVHRVAGRIGLVAATGELATRLGITGWKKGSAFDAAARRFREWLDARGGAGAAEDREALAQVRQFVEQHGMSRFEPAWAIEEDIALERGHEVRIANRAGFRKLSSKDGVWIYLVLPEVWKSEVCKGLDPGRVARVLKERGILREGEGRHMARKVRIPGYGAGRAYVLDFGGSADDAP